MKAKIMVITQIFFLIAGISIFIVNNYMGMDNNYWLLLIALSNWFFGMAIGIGIGTRIESE